MKVIPPQCPTPERPHGPHEIYLPAGWVTPLTDPLVKPVHCPGNLGKEDNQ